MDGTGPMSGYNDTDEVKIKAGHTVNIQQIQTSVTGQS